MKLLLPLLLLPLTVFGTLTVADRGTVAGSFTSQSSFTCSPTTQIDAGSTGVLIVEGDNGGNSGVSNFVTTPITDSAGNIWTLRFDSTSGLNANLGVEGAIYTCTKLAANLGTSGTVTVAVTTAITAKAYQFYQVNSDVTGAVALPVATNGSSGSTASPTITTGPVVNFNNVGDLIFGAEGIEGTGVTVTGSAFNTNGTWSTLLTTSTSGTTTSAIQIASQWKVVTAVGTQTFNPTWTGALDQNISFITMTEIDQKGRRVVATSANATSWVISPTDPLAVGSLGVLVLATDNAGSTGNVANINSAVAGTAPGQGAGSILGTTGLDSAGNTWTLRVTGINTASGLNGGAELGIFTAPITNAMDSSTTITIPFGATCAAKAAVIWEFTGTSTPTYVTGADSGTTSTGTPTITTSSITSGDIVIGGGAAEGTNTWVGATDATNGTWTKQGAQAQSTGAATMAVSSQYKITTGTGTQLYNPTLTAADVHVGWVQIHPPSLGPTAAQKSAFFMLFP